MSIRLRRLVAVLVVLSLSPAFAKDKDKKQKPLLPAYVLEARTVAVVVLPNATQPITNPNLNRDAQEAVEQALAKWGRLHPAIDAQTADLVIGIRKGIKSASSTISGPGVGDRPVILQPSDTGIRIGGQRGKPPDISRDPTMGPGDRPAIGSTSGTDEDIFEVYQGNREYPLDSMVVWRYTGKNALNAPNVPAVAAFRKVLEEALKQQQSQKPQKP